MISIYIYSSSYKYIVMSNDTSICVNLKENVSSDKQKSS